MFLPTIFFFAFALYICLMVSMVVLLLYNYRKTKYPNLSPMKQGIDFFTQNDRNSHVSTVTFWLDPRQNKKIITMLPEESRFFVMTNIIKGNNKPTTFREIIDAGRKIYVFAPTPDLQYVFKMLAYVYHNSKFTFEFVKDERLAGYNCEFTKKKIVKHNVPYNDAPIDRINFFLPFARFTRNSKDELFLIIDYLLFDDGPWKKEWTTLQTGKDDLNNFYALYLPFYNMSENFNNLSIIIDKPIPKIKSILNKYDDLRILKFPLQFGKELYVGDNVSISNQNNYSDNGKFYVGRIDKDFVYIQSYKHILNFYDTFDIIEKNDNLMKGKIKPNMILLNNIVWFMDLDLPGSIKDGIALIWKNKGYEDSYHCIPDNSYKTQESCENTVDVVGIPKEFMLWDRMCKNNTDCPFFDEAKSYRGGCTNGFCEMPVGVSRVGYTRYIQGDNSFPYCHQCKNFSSSNCCSMQKSPIYAFPFDYSSSLIS